jgi:hypothetical protein
VDIYEAAARANEMHLCEIGEGITGASRRLAELAALATNAHLYRLGAEERDEPAPDEYIETLVNIAFGALTLICEAGHDPAKHMGEVPGFLKARMSEHMIEKHGSGFMSRLEDVLKEAMFGEGGPLGGFKMKVDDIEPGSCDRSCRGIVADASCPVHGLEAVMREEFERAEANHAGEPIPTGGGLNGHGAQAPADDKPAEVNES